MPVAWPTDSWKPLPSAALTGTPRFSATASRSTLVRFLEWLAVEDEPLAGIIRLLAAADYLGRRHSAEKARAAVETAQAAGFDTVSVDLIFGLPGQTAAHCRVSVTRRTSMTERLGISSARRTSVPRPAGSRITPSRSGRNSFIRDSPGGRGSVSWLA